MEFALKRETFHYAVNYVDRYLSKVENVRKIDLQLIGVTSLFIASKMEEIISPKVKDFAKSTDDGYTVEEIVTMEKFMVKQLQYLLVPPTSFMWANWFMSQWDLFVDQNLSPESIKEKFKESNEKSYMLFREVM